MAVLVIFYVAEESLLFSSVRCWSFYVDCVTCEVADDMGTPGVLIVSPRFLDGATIMIDYFHMQKRSYHAPKANYVLTR
jgi:hypothetical protein